MSKLWRRIALLGAVGCFGSCTFGCGVVYGLMYQTGQTYQARYRAEREMLEPLFASDPVFADIRCHPRSDGGVFLEGTVPTLADHERLSERIIRLVGETRARELVIGVSVSR